MATKIYWNPANKQPTKLIVKFLKGTGTWALFSGAKNLGSNWSTPKSAVRDAQRNFPTATVTVKAK